jgi:hypothetical protein
MRDVQSYAWVHFYVAHLAWTRGDIPRAANDADRALAEFDKRFKDPYEQDKTPTPARRPDTHP